MIKNHGATRSIPLRAIKFVHTIETGTRIIGRAMLSRSGEVIVTGMSDAFRECLNRCRAAWPHVPAGWDQVLACLPDSIQRQLSAGATRSSADSKTPAPAIIRRRAALPITRAIPQPQPHLSLLPMRLDV